LPVAGKSKKAELKAKNDDCGCRGQKIQPSSTLEEECYPQDLQIATGNVQ